MGKKTSAVTAVLFAMGSLGTCVASQLPDDSNIPNLPLAGISEYVAVSSSSIADNNILVAKNDEIKIKGKNVVKFKPKKEKPVKEKPIKVRPIKEKIL